MPLTKLYLVRHGQSAKNVEGRFGGHSVTPLSDLGNSQAAITAKTLKRERVSVIYSSDLPRAVQTAEPSSSLLDVYINKTKAFVKETSVKELQHYAEDAGKTKEEIAKIIAPKKEFAFEAKGVLMKK